MLTLKELIDSEPLNNARTDEEVLAWLAGPSDTYNNYTITAAGVMSVLGAEAGAAFLDKLEEVAAASSPVKWAMKFLVTDGVDLSNPQTRLMLDQLVSMGVISAAVCATLKALPTPVTRLQSVGITTLGMSQFNAARGK